MVIKVSLVPLSSKKFFFVNSGSRVFFFFWFCLDVVVAVAVSEPSLLTNRNFYSENLLFTDPSSTEYDCLRIDG